MQLLLRVFDFTIGCPGCAMLINTQVQGVDRFVSMPHRLCTQLPKPIYKNRVSNFLHRPIQRGWHGSCIV
jgi:hypothetical protein